MQSVYRCWLAASPLRTWLARPMLQNPSDQRSIHCRFSDMNAPTTLLQNSITTFEGEGGSRGYELRGVEHWTNKQEGIRFGQGSLFAPVALSRASHHKSEKQCNVVMLYTVTVSKTDVCCEFCRVCCEFCRGPVCASIPNHTTLLGNHTFSSLRPFDRYNSQRA